MMGAVESHHPESISGNNVPITALQLSPKRPPSQTRVFRNGVLRSGRWRLTLPATSGPSDPRQKAATRTPSGY